MKKHLLFALCSVLFLSACGTTAARLDAVREEYAVGNFENQKIGDRNLDPLLTGNALFQKDQFAASDAAFEDINRRMSSAQSTGVVSEVGKALSGQMAGSYKPYFMDDLFVSYYQIWVALIDGRIADARAIINQSYAKQQALSREFASLIRSREKDNNGLGAKLREDNAQWASFSDIMNPALTYLSGLYFLNYAETLSDFETARTYLARANGMVPGNEYVRSDLALAAAGNRPVNIAWVFIESGFAPRLQERRIDWPVLFGSGVSTISIAVSDAMIIPGSPAPAGAKLLADVDAMFMTEYKEYSVNEALRAVASVIAKGAVQHAANKHLGIIGGLGAAVYSIATTGAEIRSWITLPKYIYLLRVEKTGNNDGLISLKIGDSVLSEIKVPRNGNHLIYIRMPTNAFEPKIIKTP